MRSGPSASSSDGSSGRWPPVFSETADPFAVATALWACQHGLASLEARATEREAEIFDWDTAAALTTDALLRGFT